MSLGDRKLDVGLLSDRFFRKSKAKTDLKTLQAWPDSLKGQFAKVVEINKNRNQTYWNFKIGCSARIVSGSNDNWSDHRLEALYVILKALDIVEGERPEKPNTSVTALISWPHMFQSEICIHFTSEHELNFTPEAYQSSVSGKSIEEHSGYTVTMTRPKQTPFEQMGISLPSNLDIGGYHMSMIDEDGENQSGEWWSVMRSNHRLINQIKKTKANADV